jgi:hypothetical protein
MKSPAARRRAGAEPRAPTRTPVHCRQPDVENGHVRPEGFRQAAKGSHGSVAILVFVAGSREAGRAGSDAATSVIVVDDEHTDVLGTRPRGSATRGDSGGLDVPNRASGSAGWPSHDEFAAPPRPSLCTLTVPPCKLGGASGRAPKPKPISALYAVGSTNHPWHEHLEEIGGWSAGSMPTAGRSRGRSARPRTASSQRAADPHGAARRRVSAAAFASRLFTTCGDTHLVGVDCQSYPSARISGARGPAFSRSGPVTSIRSRRPRSESSIRPFRERATISACNHRHVQQDRRRVPRGDGAACRMITSKSERAPSASARCLSTCAEREIGASGLRRLVREQRERTRSLRRSYSSFPRGGRRGLCFLETGHVHVGPDGAARRPPVASPQDVTGRCRRDASTCPVFEAHLFLV